jgi:hypothetical protein
VPASASAEMFASRLMPRTILLLHASLLLVRLELRRMKVESSSLRTTTCIQRDLNTGLPALLRAAAWRFPQAQRMFGLSLAVAPPLKWMNLQ